MSDIEFKGCIAHRGTLDDPCPWCEIERLREIEHAANRAVCSYFNALDNNDTRLARMQDLSKALLPRRCG